MSKLRDAFDEERSRNKSAAETAEAKEKVRERTDSESCVGLTSLAKRIASESDWLRQVRAEVTVGYADPVLLLNSLQKRLWLCAIRYPRRGGGYNTDRESIGNINVACGRGHWGLDLSQPLTYWVLSLTAYKGSDYDSIRRIEDSPELGNLFGHLELDQIGERVDDVLSFIGRRIAQETSEYSSHEILPSLKWENVQVFVKQGFLSLKYPL